MKMEDCFMVDDEFLNFTLEEEGEEEEEKGTISKDRSSSSSLEDHSRSFSESVEEELEWLSNKDAFPAVEFDIFSDNPNILFDHHSPVSVLGNNSSSGSNGNGNESTIMSCCGSLQVPINYPVRPRSKRRRRKRRTGFPDLPSQHFHQRIQVNSKNDKQEKALLSLPMTNAKSASSIGRRCQHCGVDNTPQWRAGPMGPKTLCNACGVRYKSGRLLPEYRPANSPTYSAAVHSNSHRKVLEMRKQKMGVGGVMIHEGCRYRVG